MREVFHSYENVDLLRQIIWHDFYASLMYFLPEEDTLGGGNMQHKKIKWKHSESMFRKWCDGKTGVPFVDAGMRQLNETGWMHNRLRLITSNYLTMVLKIDWKKGEKYFAQKLVDYDVASNNLNWQFSGQVGTDRNPYAIVYNPYLQSKKYDKDCKYIKKWVPELRDVDCKLIHKSIPT
jgi:deoxyribodipyrimidine photo-lyase